MSSFGVCAAFQEGCVLFRCFRSWLQNRSQFFTIRVRNVWYLVYLRVQEVTSTTDSAYNTDIVVNPHSTEVMVSGRGGTGHGPIRRVPPADISTYIRVWYARPATLLVAIGPWTWEFEEIRLWCRAFSVYRHTAVRQSHCCYGWLLGPLILPPTCLPPLCHDDVWTFRVSLHSQ